MGTNVNGAMAAGWKVWGAVLGILTAIGISGSNWVTMNREIAVGAAERAVNMKNIDRNDRVITELVTQRLENGQTVARIDERLLAMKTSLERIETRLEEKLR
ncbi:MAG TPA: hypothetical protein VM492_01995 [Sumerlaeia bacterium]|nr:hypothetical protein [Sumerlaeia bacterium]